MTVSSCVVGNLACQRNSFLKTFTSKVVSCQEYVAPKVEGKKGKKKKADKSSTPEKLYEVQFEDTILFPEGGGQPTDKGTLETGDGETVPVKYVKREGLQAVHYVPQPLKVGTEATMKVDWDLRFDHMQQHTGQHLLSAVLDQMQLPTLSWNMADTVDCKSYLDCVNYVEIPRRLTDAEVASVSRQVNEYIAQSIPITVEVPSKEDVNTSKMPDNYDIENGVLRVIHIGDLDANTCCGTHLTSTSQIKAVALLKQSSGKKGNARVNFVCGERVYKYAEEAGGILKELMGSMSATYSDLAEKGAEAAKENKHLKSKVSGLMLEIAEFRAKQIRQELETKKVAYEYRPDAELPYFQRISKELEGVDGTVVLFSGETNQPGAVLVIGSDYATVVAGLKERLSGLRGGGKGRFQGKVTSYEKGEITKVTKYLEEIA